MLGDSQSSLGGFSPHGFVELVADSKLFRKQYSVEVLDHNQGFIKVRIPLDDGKLVLLPVGTSVEVTDETKRSIRATVVDRLIGREKWLVLSYGDGEQGRKEPNCRVYVISSGKGGVGKTSLAVNIGVCLAMRGKKVCLIDADLGTANVDVLLNMSPGYNLGHVVSGEKSIFEVLAEGPHGLVVLPGGSGLQELTDLDARQYARIMEEFRLLERYVDVILIDTGAGLSRGVTTFLQAADEGIIVTSPEPHAITDAYALIKVLARTGPDRTVPLSLVVNRVKSLSEGKSVADKVIFASRRFLGMNVKELGVIPDDDAVEDAIRRQCDFITAYPRCRASLAVQDICRALMSEEIPAKQRAGFWQRLLAAARPGRA